MFIPRSGAAGTTSFVLFLDSENNLPAVADRNKTLLGLPQDGLTRNFFITGAGVAWGTPNIGLPTRCAIRFWDNVNTHYVEIYDGPLQARAIARRDNLAIVSRRHQYTQVFAETLLAVPTIPGGGNFGPTPNPSPFAQPLEDTETAGAGGQVLVYTPPIISDTQYLVDPTVDTWIIVGVGGPSWGDWQGPLTPTGKYDLRFTGDAFGSGLSCLRWVANVLYDASNPFSPPYLVESFNFTIFQGSAPSSAPFGAGLGSGGGYSAPSVEQNVCSQTMLYESIGLRHYEGSDDTGWALGKTARASAKLRYKYNGNVLASTAGSSPATVSPGWSSPGQGPGATWSRKTSSARPRPGPP